MPRKMHAAVVEQFGKPLVLREWDIPSPGAGQILVKTEACGVCHTDLHAAHGDWPVKPTLPFIPGHEGIGRVAAVGAGVTIVKEGDRVGVPWLYSACGHCEYCLTGLGDGVRPGAVRRLHEERRLCRVHPRRPELRRPCACRPCGQGCGADHLRRHHHLQGDQGDRSEAWRMDRHLRRWRPRASGDPIRQGHGTHVCAIDIDDGKLAHAKRLGADLVINAKAGDPAAALEKETGGGAHGVLITAPSLGAFKQGVGMTRKRGTCVLVGLPPGEFPVPLFDVVANCITIRGSFVGTRQDMAEALAFAAQGKVKADIELQPLSSINRVFDRLERGDVAGRVVLEFATG